MTIEATARKEELQSRSYESTELRNVARRVLRLCLCGATCHTLLQRDSFVLTYSGLEPCLILPGNIHAHTYLEDNVLKSADRHTTRAHTHTHTRKNQPSYFHAQAPYQLQGVGHAHRGAQLRMHAAVFLHHTHSHTHPQHTVINPRWPLTILSR